MSENREKTENKIPYGKSQGVKQDKRQGKQKTSQTVTSNPLELLITVVNRKKAEYYVDLIQSFEVNLQTTIFGRGTANAKTLELLGLTDSDKAVIFSVIQQDRIDDALQSLEEKFKTIKDGKGIALTVPLTSVIGALIFRFLSNNGLETKEENE